MRNGERIVIVNDAIRATNKSSDTPELLWYGFWHRYGRRMSPWNITRHIRIRLNWLAIRLEKSNAVNQGRSTDAIGSMTKVVRLEIKVDKICQLIKERQVCAADFHCMDCTSRNCIRKLFLQACSRSFVEHKPVGNE